MVTNKNILGKRDEWKEEELQSRESQSSFFLPKRCIGWLACANYLLKKKLIL